METRETTIQIRKGVKRALDARKLYPRESYNAIIERLLSEDHRNGRLSRSTIKNINQSLGEIRAGKYVTFEEVKRKAGLR
ncbi:MAG: hypothetical protein KGH98_00770 [Candidatus Micrarchaeota archaeon]|nr:hypothetical protein [Candidatus Micrarchaeota archaeon]